MRTSFAGQLLVSLGLLSGGVCEAIWAHDGMASMVPKAWVEGIQREMDLPADCAGCQVSRRLHSAPVLTMTDHLDAPQGCRRPGR